MLKSWRLLALLDCVVADGIGMDVYNPSGIYIFRSSAILNIKVMVKVNILPTEERRCQQGGRRPFMLPHITAWNLGLRQNLIINVKKCIA